MTSLFAADTHFVWTSPAVPLLASDDSPIGVTLNTTQCSLVTSLLYAGLAIGSTASPWPLEHLGRKITILVALIPASIAWFIILFASSVELLYVARLIAGLGVGMILSTASIYNGEISENDIRGKLSNLVTLGVLAANVYVYLIGPFVSYTVLSIVCIPLPFISFIFCLLIPESPYYLIKKGKVEEARASLKRLSASSASKEFVEKRLKEIQLSVEHDMRNKSSFSELWKKEYRKSTIVAFGLRILMYASGLYCIFSYVQTITASSGSSISPSIASIIFGGMQFVAGIISGQVVDRLGRKPLLIVSYFFCTVALTAEGIYFYLKEATSYNVDSISWLPLTALVIYDVFVIIGVYSLPFVVIGEIFPINVKGVAVSVNSFLGAPLGVLVVMTFQPICDFWGSYVAFWMYAVFCFAGILFTIFYIPETKGKSFMEIQAKMNK